MQDSESLQIPCEVTTNAQEVLRAWIVDGGLVCSLLPTAWDNSSTWGILLADVARHVADGVHGTTGASKEEALREIWQVFNSELDYPTDVPTGRFL